MDEKDERESIVWVSVDSLFEAFEEEQRRNKRRFELWDPILEELEKNYPKEFDKDTFRRLRKGEWYVGKARNR